MRQGRGVAVSRWALCLVATCLAGIACRQATAGFPARALPPPDADVLIGAGDIAGCDGTDDDATGRLVKTALERRPRARAFTLGDNAYPAGTSEQFERCYQPAWGSFRERTLAIAGNHDWMTTNAAGFRQYFGLAAEGPLYRAETVGSWRVVMLDTDCAAAGACTAGSAQLAWLATELSNHRDRCTLVLAHHPRFSSGAHGPSEAHQPMWQVLAAGGADLVLSGHEHHYERFERLDAAGRPSPSGARQMIVGTGGRSHYPLRAEPAPGSQLRMTGRAGVLVLTLEPASYRFSFVTVDGRVADEGRGDCVGAPASAGR